MSPSQIRSSPIRQGPNVDPPYNNSSRALGPPDGPGTSLGNGSEGDITDASLILRFDDNSLTPSGDSTADLHIFEGGPAVEEMEISISKDGQAWIFLGLLEGQPTSIDIDGTAGVAPGDLFRFVRLSDAGEGASGSPFGGADIDAVGAISSSFDVPDIPQIAAPAALPLLGLGLAALVAYRRR